MSDEVINVPFVVEQHDLMAMLVPGKNGDTMLAIERNIYNFKIREYTEPLWAERQWCYPTLERAYRALMLYLGDPEAKEPTGWTRAVTENGIRRAEEAVDEGGS